MKEKKAPKPAEPKKLTPSRRKPRREIRLSNECPGLEFDAPGVRAAIRCLDESGQFDVAPGELSVVFLNNERIAALHQDYLDDPAPTDTITFPGDPAMEFAGEICLSAEMAARYAEQRKLSFGEELTLYLVHGYLHLAGFDDKDPAARRAMRRAEKKALNLLAESGRMPHFALRTA